MPKKLDPTTRFLLDAQQWPLGGTLATAVGTAATVDVGTALVEALMIANGVPEEDAQANARDVHNAVKEFIENTDFRFKPGKKYWTDESISYGWDPCGKISCIPVSGPIQYDIVK